MSDNHDNVHRGTNHDDHVNHDAAADDGHHDDEHHHDELHDYDYCCLDPDPIALGSQTSEDACAGSTRFIRCIGPLQFMVQSFRVQFLEFHGIEFIVMWPLGSNRDSI